MKLATVKLADDTKSWVVDLALKIGDDIVNFTDLVISDMKRVPRHRCVSFATLGADIKAAVEWLKHDVGGKDPDGWQVGLGIVGPWPRPSGVSRTSSVTLQQFADPDSGERGKPSGIIDYFDVVPPYRPRHQPMSDRLSNDSSCADIGAGGA